MHEIDEKNECMKTMKKKYWKKILVGVFDE